MKMNMKLVTFASCAFNICCIYYVNYICSSTLNLNKTRTFSTDRDNSAAGNKFKPAVVYVNADTQKMQIIKENKGRSGVYRLINLSNGKSYIGSSINLSRRFTQYFYLNHLLRNTCMPICSALLKYGYSNFSLVILEYCDPSECLARENHFLASLKPEYNIAKDAQAPFFNRLHTPETKAKMSEAQAGRNHTPETRGLMSILKTGENNPMYGRTGEKHPM